MRRELRSSVFELPAALAFIEEKNPKSLQAFRFT